MSNRQDLYLPLPIFDKLEHLDRRHLPSHIKINIKDANDDYYYAANFLYSYRGSDATFNAYRREIEKFLYWCWFVIKKSVREIRRTEIEAFIEFCQTPPLTLIGIKNVPRFMKEANGNRIAHPEWRPFVVTVSKIAYKKGEQADPKKYALSQKAIQAIFAILGSFYGYLIQENYIDANPVAQIRQKSKFIRKQQMQVPIRRLSELQWSYVIETAEMLAKRDPKTHERTLFIMTILFALYLRISELSASARWQPKMGDFYMDGDGNWWFTTVGKGNKQRSISVSDAMLNALKRYRLSRSLSPLPFPGETTHLLTSTNEKNTITSTRHIRLIVQNCFDATIERLHQDGFLEESEQLKTATVHWLRHTGISEDVKYRPREHVRDDAGHSSSAITDKYIDVERRARHASKRKTPIDSVLEEKNSD